MKDQDSANEWSWPVPCDAYDNTIALSDTEISFLSALPAPRINYSGARLPTLAPVHRLVKPLEDVFIYMDVRKPKRDQLLPLLLQEMGKRRISFWGWKDEEWIQISGNHPYFANWLIAAAFLLCGFRSLYAFPKRSQIFSSLAHRVFGPQRFSSLAAKAQQDLAALGYKARTLRLVPLTLAHLLLSIRSPCIEDLTIDAFRGLQRAEPNVATEKCLVAVSRSLAAKGILQEPMSRVGPAHYMDDPKALLVNVPPEWARLARYWFDHSTLGAKAKVTRYYRVLCIGRWLNATHPEIQSPDQWTRTTAAEAIAMLTTQTSGEWSHFPSERILNFGKPYAANTRLHGMTSLRLFFQDLQQWDVIPRRFDPYRAFRCPRSITCLLERNPRVLADDVWAKLIWAGMNLAEGDLRGQGGRDGRFHFCPFSFVRAVAMVWLFAGLRWNEIRRLRLGCIRWQEDSSRQRVCLLSVPVNKTATAFTKPVDKLAGEAIEAWEKDRPLQRKMLDAKTGEQVDFLFLSRMRQVDDPYLNTVLIPALCKKAGLPCSDVRGRITGHRARSTIASQLFNAREPMTLFELQQWLGHKHPSSTQHYIKITPTKLMNSYTKAGYFERNVRAIEVLIDQDVVRQGLGGKEPWKFFDLGHGYCTYDFFDQCPHRMACAQCSFYVPKQSARAQMLEAKSNLVRLRQDIPLSEPELAAVDEGLAAYDKLLAGLADVPAPDGETPRQLAGQDLHQIRTVTL